MISHGHAKTFLAPGRIEILSSDHSLEPRHERLEFSKHMFSPHRALVSTPTANEEEISEHLP